MLYFWPIITYLSLRLNIVNGGKTCYGRFEKNRQSNKGMWQINVISYQGKEKENKSIAIINASVEKLYRVSSRKNVI